MSTLNKAGDCRETTADQKGLGLHGAVLAQVAHAIYLVLIQTNKLGRIRCAEIIEQIRPAIWKLMCDL